MKTKLDQPAPAEELFVSPLFRARRAHAERRGLPWFVLSSRHGLLRPADVVAPYDVCMIAQPVAYRRAWGARVAGQLAATVSDLAGATLEFHAGAAHIDSVEAALQPAGPTVLRPLRGLNQGQHLAWYVRRGFSP